MLLSNLSKKVAIGMMVFSLAFVSFSVISPVSAEAGSGRAFKLCVRYITLPFGRRICVEWKTIYIPVFIPNPVIPIGCPQCGLGLDFINPIDINPVIIPGNITNPGR